MLGPMSSQPIPYPLRMPDELREQINTLAKVNNRSLNTEIVLLLQQAVDARTSGTAAGVDVDALAEALAPKLAARLKDTSQ